MVRIKLKFNILKGSMGSRINIFKTILTLIIGMGGPFRFYEVLLQLTKHSIMGVNPFELVLGVKARQPMDLNISRM
jgi:hypothetical protein